VQQDHLQQALATSERSPVRHDYGVVLRQDSPPGTYISVSEPADVMTINSRRSEATDLGMIPSSSLSCRLTISESEVGRGTYSHGGGMTTANSIV
jgi:hypothetical protein